MDLGLNVGIGVAFIAGFLSFISPCCLPLIPTYVGYLGGRATTQMSMELVAVGAGVSTAAVARKNRLNIFLHGVLFVLGFTFVFVFFGLATNASLQLLRARSYDFQLAIAHVGGALVVFFGLHVMGVTGWLLRMLITRVDWDAVGGLGKGVCRTLERIQMILYADTRRQMNPNRTAGYTGSALMGVVFAAGWTPCVGPIYGAILTMVANNNSVGRAAVLLLSYSLGLGFPFLLTALALDQARGLLKRLQRQMRVIEVFSGVFLIAIGYLLYSGRLAELARFGTGISDFSYKLEACVTGVGQGDVTISEFNTCMTLGPDYKELQNPTQQPGQTVPVSSIVVFPTAVAAPAKVDVASVGLDVGQAAPDFDTQLVGGQPISLSSLRGKVVLLNFWATWCGPCRQEMPSFQRLAANFDKKDFEVLAVNFQEQPDIISNFTSQVGLTLDIALDLKGTINRLYGVAQYPVSYVIGRDGKILARQYGPFQSIDGLDQALKKWIAGN